MKLDIEIINRLKQLGFTEADISELDRLSAKFDQNDLYRQIGKINNSKLGIDIRPVKIDIANIEKRMSVDKEATPSKIIKEYQREEMVLNGAPTTAQSNYYNQVALELSSYGIDVTPEQLYELYSKNDLHISMIEEILLWFRRYIYLVLEGVERFVREAVDNINLAHEILANYSGIDPETGEVIDINNKE